MPCLRIEIDGIPIDIVRKPIKNMHLRIYPPDGRVCVSVPLRLSLTHIYKKIETKCAWLHAQRAKLQARPAAIEPTLQTGEQHYFLGYPYTLVLNEVEGAAEVYLEGDRLQLCTSPNSTIEQKQHILKKWHQTQMQLIVPTLIEKWQPLMGVTVTAWGSKTMKTRWGSCNVSTHCIWLNLILITKPEKCLEYVLVHEMIHLLEASHNQRFHRLMDNFMPDWRIHKIALNSTTG